MSRREKKKKKIGENRRILILPLGDAEVDDESYRMICRRDSKLSIGGENERDRTTTR